VLIYNLVFSVGMLPQHGPLRFGLPIALILAATAEARWPSHARGARVAQYAVVGLSSIWALEAFAYTAFTFVALAGLRAWMGGEGGRIASLAREAAWALAACVAVQLLFIVATLAFAGQLPDYGWYFAFLDAFLRGNLAELTYDFSPWSAGLAVGVGYAVSAAGLVLLIRRRADLVEREKVLLTALGGVTAYGIGLFSYFVDRSPDHVLPYVSLPLILAAALWLSLLLRGLVESPAARLAWLGFALSFAVLLVSVAWSSIGTRFERSALAHALPGGSSLSGAIHRLWHPPPLNLAAPEGEHLLDVYMPGQRRVLIVVKPDLATEILVRSARSNQLPFSDPLEDSFVGAHELPSLRRAVAGIEPGDRLLTQRDGLRMLAGRGVGSATAPLADRLTGSNSLTPQQNWVLQRIGKRFQPRVIQRDDAGFVVVSLAPRRAGG
jgi:hypothetical protein